MIAVSQPLRILSRIAFWFVRRNRHSSEMTLQKVRPCHAFWERRTGVTDVMSRLFGNGARVPLYS